MGQGACFAGDFQDVHNWKHQGEDIDANNKVWFLEQDPGTRVRLGVTTHGADKAISSDFTFGRRAIGEGAYGKVRRATSRKNSEQRAIKEIRKKREKEQKRGGMTKELITQEVLAMDALDHPNIVRLFEVYQDHLNIYLVMEFCAGGDLCDAIQKEESFTEHCASHIMQQVFNGVCYMHRKRICHRDLKPDNFLLQDKLTTGIADCHLKIVDFGCVWHFQDGEYAKKKVGSIYYIAPEVLMRNYLSSCDLWSCGIIVYILLCGYPPFKTENEIMNGKMTFDARDWRTVSDDAKELIKLLVERDVGKRWTAEQTLSHVWISQVAPKANKSPLQVQGRLMDFTKHNAMKKAALTIVARNLSDTQIQGLRHTFLELDKNRDGTISAAELEAGLKKSDLGDQVKELLKGLDMNGDGTVDYTEFIAGSLEQKQYTEESACWSAFKTFDADGTGTISMAEMAKVLEHEDLKAVLNGKCLNELFAECDKDHSGEIDFQEFMKLMRDGQ